jgi:hypothetical protein
MILSCLDLFCADGLLLIVLSPNMNFPSRGYLLRLQKIFQTAIGLDSRLMGGSKQSSQSGCLNTQTLLNLVANLKLLFVLECFETDLPTSLTYGVSLLGRC